MSFSVLVDGHSVPLLGVAALGLVIGYIAGMFGIGGGFLLTPLLVVLFKIPLPIAVGTGLCQMIGTALVGFLRHRKVGQGEVRFDLLLLPGSLLGVELGARTLGVLSDAGNASIAGHEIPWVNLIVEGSYALLMTTVAINYWRHGKGAPAGGPGPLARIRFGPGVRFPAVGLTGVSPFVVAYIGLGLGFLSGLLGIGGGIALNPILIYGFGFPIKQAVGTGIVVLFATAIVGTITHALKGHVHLTLAVTMMVGATVTAQLGALNSRRLSATTLSRFHAVVIIAAISAVCWDLVRHIH